MCCSWILIFGLLEGAMGEGLPAAFTAAREVLLDCISRVTATPNKFKDLLLGSRAVQIADGDTTQQRIRQGKLVENML